MGETVVEGWAWVAFCLCADFPPMLALLTLDSPMWPTRSTSVYNFCSVHPGVASQRVVSWLCTWAWVIHSLNQRVHSLALIHVRAGVQLEEAPGERAHPLVLPQAQIDELFGGVGDKVAELRPQILQHG